MMEKAHRWVSNVSYGRDASPRRPRTVRGTVPTLRGSLMFCSSWVIIGFACLGLRASAEPVVVIRRFEPESNVCRAGRAEPVVAVIENAVERETTIRARLAGPAGVKVTTPESGPTILAAGGQAVIRWQVEAAAACDGELSLEVIANGKVEARAAIRTCFLAAREDTRPPQPETGVEGGRPREPRGAGGYMPPPQPVRTEMLIGAHHCPLWESDKPEMWSNVLKHPERTPALGFYSQENPEVSDWETKWAVEHGISFFVYCWYRTQQGGPVKTHFSSAIHEALFKSRFVDRMKYTIMWENQSRGSAGVSGEKDLFENLLPFWIENYFKHPSYLKVDNKPVLFVYRPEYLVQDLGLSLIHI